MEPDLPGASVDALVWAPRAGPRRRRVRLVTLAPRCLRQAIVAAEDKRFFTHSGVDYRALPRVVQKMAVRSLAAWWKGGQGLRRLLPQGGSTLTQQLVRGCFLRDLTSRSDQDALFHVGPSARKTNLFRVITLSRSSLWSWPRMPASRGGFLARYLRIRMFPFGR